MLDMAASAAFLDWKFHFWPGILDRAAQLIQEVMVTAGLAIAEQVAKHHRAPPGQLPAGVAEAFAAEQRDLAAAGLPSVTAGPGDRMPNGNLLDVAGQPTSLAKALGSRPGVIVFYRGGWCPYCNIALRTYQARLVPALADLGIPLVAISPQSPDRSLISPEGT
jgi:hypothetical protein